MSFFCEAEIETKTYRTDVWMPRGKWGWEELGDWDCHIYAIDTCIKWITSENTLYSTRSSTYALWWSEREGSPKGSGYVHCHCLVAKSWPPLCNPWTEASFPVLCYLQELAQTHVHRVGDVIQPSHPLLPPSPPALNLSQLQGLFQWVSSLHQVAKVSELQHQSFQWIYRAGFFRIDWFALVAIQGTFKSLLQHHNSKA